MSRREIIRTRLQELSERTRNEISATWMIPNYLFLIDAPVEQYEAAQDRLYKLEKLAESLAFRLSLVR